MCMAHLKEEHTQLMRGEKSKTTCRGKRTWILKLCLSLWGLCGYKNPQKLYHQKI